MNGFAAVSTEFQPECEMDDGMLAKKFEEDMIPARDGMRMHFDKSEARKELHRRAVRAFPAIVTHVRTNPPGTLMPSARSAGRWAWCMLFAGMEAAIRDPASPTTMCDVEPWITWAERLISAT